MLKTTKNIHFLFFFILFLGFLPVAAATEIQTPSLLTVDLKPILDAVGIGPVAHYTSILAKNPRLRVRSIEVVGNTYTDESAIRKMLSLKTGSVITPEELDASKRRIEGLGCFARDGVTWKIHNIFNDLADLQLIIQEPKPGSFSVLTGGTPRRQSETAVVSVGTILTRYNLLGLADKAEFSIGTPGSPVGVGEFSYDVPNVANSDIGCGVDAYYKVKDHTVWTLSYEYPREHVAGASAHVDICFPDFDRDTKFQCEVGLEKSFLANEDEFERAKNSLRRFDPSMLVSNKYSEFAFDRMQQLGMLGWIALSVAKDTRNHPRHPSEGTHVVVTSKLGLPQLALDACFVKHEAMGCLYFPLIGAEELVLAVRAKAGTVRDISRAGRIPYRELYQVGSKDTIRAFMPGGAGPMLMGSSEKKETWGTPLGAQHYVVCNAELRTPIHAFPTWGLRGRLFYDLGCGWGVDTKDIPADAQTYVLNADFAPRQAVGVGLSITEGWFFKTDIDVGWKLDRSDSFNELPLFVYGSLTASW